MSVAKKKSIIRKEALLLIGFIVLVLSVYFAFFFTLHLKWIAQKTLTKVYGAEVNIEKLAIGISPPTLTVTNMQFTDHQKPSYNLFELGHLSFKLVTKDLLFSSFTAEEARLTGIRVNRPRKSPGYVNPKTQQLVSLSLDLSENRAAVVNNKTEGNILDNIASFSKTKDIKGELDRLAEDFKIDELAEKYKDRLKSQNQILKDYENLANQEQFQPIENQLKNLELKIKAKADPMDIIAMGSALLKDIKEKKEEIEKLNKQFKSQVADLKNVKADLDQDLRLKKQELKNKFKIPDISPEALAKDFFAETISTRFYLFNYWMDQIRKNSEAQVTNITSKVLTEEQSGKVKEKISVVMDVSKKEKAIKTEIADRRKAQSEIIHFGNHQRPKVWIKKTLIQADAKQSQDLQNFNGKILNIADNQKMIGKPIKITFTGDLPKENIRNINLKAVLNHHLKDINETFQLAADYPISSFKIIDDASMKLFLNKATSRTTIDGSILEKQIKNLTINNSLNGVNFLFESSKSDIQKILAPILTSIDSFNLDILLKGALDNPDLTILTSLTEKISEGLKDQIASQLTQFNDQFDALLAGKSAELKQELFSSIDKSQAKVNNEVSALNSKLGKQSHLVNDLMKDGSKKSINDKVEKLSDKLADKLFKRSKPEKKTPTPAPAPSPTQPKADQ